MALRLGRSIGQEREIDVGYQVVFTFRPFSYAELEEVKSAAQKLSRDALSLQSQMAVEAIDDEDMPDQVENEIRGKFQHVLLLTLVIRFCSKWDGVEKEDGSPAPLEFGYIDSFLTEFPGVANTLAQQVLLPYQMVAQEGKGSASLPNTVSAEA